MHCCSAGDVRKENQKDDKGRCRARTIAAAKKAHGRHERAELLSVEIEKAREKKEKGKQKEAEVPARGAARCSADHS